MLFLFLLVVVGRGRCGGRRTYSLNFFLLSFGSSFLALTKGFLSLFGGSLLLFGQQGGLFGGSLLGLFGCFAGLFLSLGSSFLGAACLFGRLGRGGNFVQHLLHLRKVVARSRSGCGNCSGSNRNHRLYGRLGRRLFRLFHFRSRSGLSRFHLSLGDRRRLRLGRFHRFWCGRRLGLLKGSKGVFHILWRIGGHILQRLLAALVGIQVQPLSGGKHYLASHAAHDSYAVKFVPVGVTLQLLVQGSHIILPHHLGYIHRHAFVLGNLANDGLIATLGIVHHHRATGGVIGARSRIVVGADGAASQSPHAREFYYISFFDEFDDKISYIHRVFYFFMLCKYRSAAARSSGVSMPMLACSVVPT